MSERYFSKVEFHKVLVFNEDFRGIDAKVQNEAYRGIAKTFSDNMERVSYLCQMPADLVAWTDLMTMAARTARLTRGIPLNDTRHDHRPDVAGIAMSLCDQWGKPMANGDIAYIRGMRGHGLRVLDSILSLFEDAPEDSKGTLHAIQALLSAALTNSYAAFEALAGDLWIQSVNMNPKLAKNFLEKNAGKSIDLTVLAGYDFDASEVMGRILCDTGKVGFQSVNRIREAYRGAFKGCVDELFSDPAGVQYTEKVRHLFAHRGGLVDEKFRRDAEGIPGLENIKIGRYLPLTGSFVCERIDACVNAAVVLLKFVDAWRDSDEYDGSRLR